MPELTSNPPLYNLHTWSARGLSRGGVPQLTQSASRRSGVVKARQRHRAGVDDVGRGLRVGVPLRLVRRLLVVLTTTTTVIVTE